MSPALRESLKIIVPLMVVWFLSLFLPGFWALGSGVSLFVLILFTLYFFRDPERTLPADEKAILSAADGLVVSVDEVDRAPLEQGSLQRVSIFLSVFDVHVNRAPYAGKIRRITHTPGAYLDVRLPEASVKNEHQDWLLETTHGPMVVRQIAGLIARRIVGWSKLEDTVTTGQRIGMIRFGSRTEIYLPKDCVITVKPGDRVQGAASVIARWP